MVARTAPGGGNTRRSLPMRVLRWGLRPLGGLVSLAALLLAAVAGFLATPAGREFVARRAIDAIDDAIPGRLEVGRVDFRWLTGLELHEVRLLTSEGEPVISMAAAVVQYRPLDLLEGTLTVRRLRLERPDVRLEADAQGALNLTRALGGSEAPPGQPPWDGQLPLEVDASDVTVVDGTLSWDDVREASPRMLELEHFNLNAAYDYAAHRHRLRLEPAAFDLIWPKVGYTTLETKLTYDVPTGGGRLTIDQLKLEAPGLRASASGAVDTGQNGTGGFVVDADPVSAGFLRALAPDLPIRGDVALHARVDIDALEKARVDARLELPKGAARLTGRVDVATRSLMGSRYDLTLALEAVDIDRLLTVETAPVSPITARAVLKGRGFDPRSMDTRVQLEVAPTVYQRYRFQGGTASGHIRDGIATIDASRIDSPYGGLAVQGRIDLDGPIDLTGTAQTGALERLGTFIGIPVRGQAAVKLRATGSLRAPRIQYDLTGKDLAYGPPGERIARVSELEAHGQLELTRKDGGRVIPHVTTRASGRGLGGNGIYLARFSLEGAYSRPDARIVLDGVDGRNQPVQLTATAALEDTVQVVRMTRLRAPFGSTSWRLERPVTATLAGDSVTLTPFVVAGADGRLTGGGTFSTSGANDLRLAGEGIDLSRFAAMMPGSIPGLRGRLKLELRLTGPAAAPVLQSRLDLTRVAARNLPLLSGVVRVTTVDAPGRRAGVQTDLSLQDGGQLVTRLNLPVPLRLTGRPELARGEPMGGFVRLHRFDLGVLGRLNASSAALNPLAGRVDGTIRLEGTPEHPELHARVEGDDIAVQKGQRVDARFRLTLDDQQMRLIGNLYHPTVRDASLATMHLDFPLEITPDLQLRPAWDRPLEGSIRIDARELQALVPLLPRLDRVSGIASMDLQVSGRPRDPALRLDLRMRRFQPETWPSTDVDVDLAYAGGRAAVISRVRIGDQPTSALEARAQVPLADILKDGRPRLSDLRAALDIPRLDLTALPPALRGPQLQQGVLTARATLESQGAVPVIDLDLQARGLAVRDHPAHDVRLTARYGGDELQLEARSATREHLEALIEGTVPLELKLPTGDMTARVAFRPGLDLCLEVPDLDLSLANAFLTGQSVIDGRLSGRATLTGSLEAPRLSGDLRLARGRLYLPAVGIFYDRIQLAAQLATHRITVTEGILKGGKGEARIGGQIQLEDNAPSALALTARFRDFTAMDGPYGRVIIEGDAAARGKISAPQVTGNLNLTEGVIKIPNVTSGFVLQVAGLGTSKDLAPTQLPATVLALTPRGLMSWAEYVTGQEATLRTPTRLTADVMLHVPRNLWIQNASQEVMGEVKGDVRALIENGDLRLAGKIETVRGEVRLFAEPMTITRGTLNFTGGSEIDPELKFLAESNIGDYGHVAMTVEGTLKRPEITFKSDRNYETEDILSLLILGKPLKEAGPGSDAKLSSRVESLAAGAISGWVRRQLADKLPIDMLQLRADSFSSADLRVGKYVTPRLFLIYRRRLGDRNEKENVNEARAEYQLSRELYVETFYGDASIWGAQVFWRRYY